MTTVKTLNRDALQEILAICTDVDRRLTSLRGGGWRYWLNLTRDYFDEAFARAMLWEEAQ